jgi:hypothetical protein
LRAMACTQAHSSAAKPSSTKLNPGLSTSTLFHRAEPDAAHAVCN